MLVSLLQAQNHEIDEAIDQSPRITARYEEDIKTTRQMFHQAAQPQERYLHAIQLYRQYRSFMNDSAVYYLEQAERAAEKQGLTSQVGYCRALKAFQCSTVGAYDEAQAFLRSIDKQQLDSLGLRHYYISQMHVYGELGYYSIIPAMKERYFSLQAVYRDSLFSVVDHADQDYLMYRINELNSNQQKEEARKLCDEWLKGIDPESRDFAIAAYYRSLTCEDDEDEDYWLGMSVLSDIRHAVMDQASLLSLADILNARGDLERSYRYIRFTWDCNNRFNTRMRSWQITPILNVIESNYQKAADRNTKVLMTSIIAVSILALLLLGLLLFVHRKNRQLDIARNALKESNDELAVANRQLATKTDELSALAAQLSKVNSQLSESNHVKEEYIGRFMSLCSQYINKLDDYRKLVNKKMKNKEFDELLRMSKSTELKEKELEELYENFDSVFLSLFPNFVNEFNALLDPETQIHPKDENRLTTEIRIFALIRLGIEDSSKIAEFLHYSVNTIYNYRARIKNGAVDNRESFERRVKQLGLIL